MWPEAIVLAQHGGPPGWLEESDPAGCDFVRDGRSIPPPMTDRTACLGLELLSCSWAACELLVNPADVLVLNVNKKPFKLYYARKAWVKTLLDPLRRQQKRVASSNSTSLDAPRVLFKQFPPQLPSAETSLNAPFGTLSIKFDGWFRKAARH